MTSTSVQVQIEHSEPPETEEPISYGDQIAAMQLLTRAGHDMSAPAAELLFRFSAGELQRLEYNAPLTPHAGEANRQTREALEALITTL